VKRGKLQAQKKKWDKVRRYAIERSFFTLMCAAKSSEVAIQL